MLLVSLEKSVCRLKNDKLTLSQSTGTNREESAEVAMCLVALCSDNTCPLHLFSSRLVVVRWHRERILQRHSYASVLNACGSVDAHCLQGGKSYGLWHAFYMEHLKTCSCLKSKPIGTLSR